MDWNEMQGVFSFFFSLFVCLSLGVVVAGLRARYRTYGTATDCRCPLSYLTSLKLVVEWRSVWESSMFSCFFFLLLLLGVVGKEGGGPNFCLACAFSPFSRERNAWAFCCMEARKKKAKKKKESKERREAATYETACIISPFFSALLNVKNLFGKKKKKSNTYSPIRSFARW